MPDDVFRWVIAIGVFLALVAFIVQTAVVLAMFRVAKAMQDKLTPVLDAAGPIVGTVRRFVDENSPKFSQMATEATDVVKSLHEQVDRLGEVVKDVSDRARAQVARIDGAVDQTVDQVQQAGDVVKHAILKPVKQMDGIVHGIRAAISVVAQGRRESVDHATQDEEMFHLMARLALVYGVRLLPADELESVGEASIVLKGGRKASVAMHLIEGGSEVEIRKQLLESLDAFFEFYPEV